MGISLNFKPISSSNFAFNIEVLKSFTISESRQGFELFTHTALRFKVVATVYDNWNSGLYKPNYNVKTCVNGTYLLWCAFNPWKA